MQILKAGVRKVFFLFQTRCECRMISQQLFSCLRWHNYLVRENSVCLCLCAATAFLPVKETKVGWTLNSPVKLSQHKLLPNEVTWRNWTSVSKSLKQFYFYLFIMVLVFNPMSKHVKIWFNDSAWMLFTQKGDKGGESR